MPQSGRREDDLLVRVDQLKNEMLENGRERDGPVRTLMSFIGDRWSSLIILVLETGDWRHADLRRVLGHLADEGGISQRVMTLKLRALEHEGLVERQVSPDIPPHVTYRLTALGKGFVLELRQLIEWVSTHARQIQCAREQCKITKDI